MENETQNTRGVPTVSSRSNSVSTPFDVPQPAQLQTQFTPEQNVVTPDLSNSQNPAEPAVSVRPPRTAQRTWLSRRTVMATVALVVLVGLGFILWRFVAPNSTLLNSTNNNHTADNFGSLDIPLSGLSQNGKLSLDSSKSLNINGQLKVNNGFVIAPSDKPVQGVAGQMYYDRGTNELNYYNGSGFVSLTNNPQTVTNINGATGAITLGGGLSLNGSQLSNSGVISITSASANLAIANDGNGNVTVSTTGGAVQSNNGTPGSIALFSDSQTITSSILTQSGNSITVNGGATIAGAASINGGATVAGTLNLQNSGVETINLTETNSGVTGQIYNDGNLHITGGSNNLWLDAGGSGTIFMNAGNSNPVAINEATIPLYPLEVNGDINITAGHSYRIGGTIICSISGCTGGGGSSVSSLNGLSGALTVANATGSGSTITINDASTSQKGIASFNSTNFTVSGGVVNTIQNIDPTANPTFVGINTSTITPNGTPLVVGSNSQDLTLQGTNVLISRISGGNSTALTFAAPTANVTYRLQTAAAGTYDVCTTVGNCVGVGGTVSTTGGTTNRLTKFTGAQTLGDSIISDNGTLVTVAGDLSVTGNVTFTNPLPVTSGGTGAVSPAGARLNLGAASSGANSDITSITGLTTALGITQGGTGATALTANGVLLGNGTSAISSLAAASANLCLVSTAGAPTWQACPGGGGVSSINGLTGAVTIANSSAAGSTITLNDASTSQKGIAQFNSTNFSVSGGVVNTIQDIAVSSAPTFGRLTVTSSQATNGMLLVNNTNGSASGNLIDLQISGSSKFAVSPAGALTLSSTINGQTISSAASFSGTLAVTGAANFNGGATVAGTLTANTITPSGSLTIGATSQTFTVQGNASSTITATSGANTTTLAFQTPTASVTYRLLTAAAGTYDICTTVGNCAGVGGGVTTTGGTTNTLAKFTGSNAIGNSIITDDGTTVTIGGTLSVNTITPAAAMTIGATSQNLTLQGAVTTLTATSGGITNTLAFATPASTNKTITLPNATGTVAVSATGPLGIDVNGNISCPSCVTSGGGGGGVGAVDSLDGLTGALTLANSTGSGTTVTINDASTSQKGIAQFNSTNFSASSGVVNTIQDISTTATPTFGQLTLSSSQSSATMLTVNNTNAGATGNLVDLKLNGTSKFAVTSAGNVTLSGTINGQTISSAANFTGTVAVGGNLTTSASLFANAATITTNLNVSGTTTTNALSVTNDAGIGGNLNVTGTITANTITPTSALTVGATSVAFTLQGNASSTITATGGGFATTIGFTGTATGAVTYNFDRAATPGTYTICTNIGNCAGTGGGVTTSGGTTNKIAKFTGTQTLGDSSITDDGTAVTIAVPLKTNTITPTAALTVGATGQNLTLQGATVSLTATSAGITNTLTFATPATSNKTITIPNATGTVAVSASGALSLDANGNITCPSCVTGTVVSSLNSQTGAVTLANAVGSGGVVTINDASTSQKGIASFNSTNFSASSGVVNTIQDINTTAAPTFGRLTITSNQGASDMFVVNNTNTGTTGSLLRLQLNGADKFTVDSAGNVVAAGTITSGNINGQTISSAASFTGSVAVATTLSVNTITPTGAMTIGSTNQNLTLQGATTSITSTSGATTSTLSFQTPTANVTYRLLTTAAGTYDICTTAGNCTGTGGGVTTSGGTTGKIVKFTGSQTIGDSIITDNSTSVTIAGNLNLTTGSQYQINGSQISSSALSNDSNLAKLNATQVFTGGTNTFRNGTDSASAFAIQNAATRNILNVNSTTGAVTFGNITASVGQGVAGTLILADGTADGFGLTLNTTTLTAARTITLPNETGTVCTTGSVCSGYQASGSFANTSLSNLSSVAINAALGFQSSSSAAINFNGSAATANTMTITGQTATASDGGAVTLQGGTGSAGNHGGAVNITGGTGAATGVNGNVNIDAGSGASTVNGTISIGTGTSNASAINIGQTNASTSQTLALQGAAINIGTSGTNTQAVTIGSSTAAGNSVTIESGGSIAIGNNGGTAHTILIGSNDTGGTHGQAITMGSTAGSGDTTLIQGGTGSTALQLQVGASGTLSMATSAVTKTLNIGSVGSTASATTIHIADTSDATAAQAVTIGSSAANTGGLTIIQGGSNTTQAIQLSPNTAGGVLIGNSAGTGTITVGQSTTTNTVNIATGTTAAGNTQTVNIATNATSTGKALVTIGNTNDGTTVTLQAGTGGIISKVGTSTTAFAVQTSGGANWFNIDTSAEKITIGPSAGDTTGALLVLGNKTTTGDPTGVVGGMYYNSGSGSFRCYQLDHWSDCLESARTSYHRIFELGSANISGGGELVGYNLGTGSGISSSISGETGHPGIPQFNTGSTATGYDYIGSPGDNEILLGNGDYWRHETELRIPSSPGLSTSAQRFIVRSGFVEQSTTNDGTDGCFFRYSDDVNGGKWQGTCLSSGTPTTCDTGTTVAAGTWYRLTVVVNAAGNSADFRINGTSACTVASNIPTGAGRVTGRGTSIQKSVGTTDRDLDVDYEEIEGQFGTPR